jgi:hypothetical protein
MKTLARALVLAAVVLAASIPLQGDAGGRDRPVLLGTLGACDNATPGGPCTTTSTLVMLDPDTGALLKTIGPVGYTVNGLAWDQRSRRLYATTALGDQKFHGLITINPFTGAGKPVNPNLVNFGLSVDPGTAGSPIHSNTIDSNGDMVGWYDEKPGPGVTDTFVRINKHTGVATEFNNTGIDTANNGLSFQSFAGFNILWNIDTTRVTGGVTTQTAYIINPANGKPLGSTQLSPPTPAALGDFNPETNLYYGLNFDGSAPVPRQTFMVVVDPFKGTVTTLGQTVDDLHVIAFVGRDVDDGRCF